MRLILVLYFVMCTLFAQDATNGTTIILTFNKQETIALKKGETKIPLLTHPTNPLQTIAFIAIPYSQKTPIELLHVTPQGREKLYLNIIEGAYDKEVLSVEPSKVSPPKEALLRIKEEREEALAIYNRFTQKRYWDTPFAVPIENVITSTYGNARLFNETLQSYHTGVDFRASIGTPIFASNDGVIVLSKDRYYAGNSIIIDHGEGVYSVYYHLDRLILQKGNFVKKGDVIGLSGSTGRVTGPHLHFGFMVQGIPTDPLDFIEKINALW